MAIHHGIHYSVNTNGGHCDKSSSPGATKTKVVKLRSTAMGWWVGLLSVQTRICVDRLELFLQYKYSDD